MISHDNEKCAHQLEDRDAYEKLGCNQEQRIIRNGKAQPPTTKHDSLNDTFVFGHVVRILVVTGDQDVLFFPDEKIRGEHSQASGNKKAPQALDSDTASLFPKGVRLGFSFTGQLAISPGERIAGTPEKVVNPIWNSFFKEQEDPGGLGLRMTHDTVPHLVTNVRDELLTICIIKG